MKIIATVRNDFSSKFGIPRQSGLVEGLYSEIVFLPAYRNPDALRGMEGFSHLWLLWYFSEAGNAGAQIEGGRILDSEAPFTPTVRPPRLGGNEKVGVFASRSPFRPNPIGLSSVKLEKVLINERGEHSLLVSGADLLSGTPILDIKPYLPFTDSHPEARSGFSGEQLGKKLTALLPEALLSSLPPSVRPLLTPEKQRAICAILESDPRPAYHDDESRIYGFPFAGMEIKFRVRSGVAEVVEIL